MSSESFATWNPRALGDGMELEEGNLVVTTGRPSLSNARKSLATMPKSLGQAVSEHEIWSIPQVNLGTRAAIGLAQPDSPLNQAVGADAKSWGFYLGTGLIVNNGSTVATLDIINEPTSSPSALRAVVSILFQVVAGTPQFILAINGSWRYGFALPSGKSYVLASTLSGGEAGELSLFSNFGQRGLNYPRISTNS